MNLTTLIWFLGESGLGGVQNTVVKQWIGPIFLILLAAGAVMEFRKRAFRTMGALIGIGAAAAVLIYFGDELLGGSGNLTKAGKSIADKVNTININTTLPSQEALQKITR